MSVPTSMKLGSVDLPSVETTESESGSDSESCKLWSLKGQIRQQGLWMFIVIAIIVIAISIYMFGGKDGHHWYKHLDMWDWGRNTTIWAVFMVVGIILFAWAAFTAYMNVADPKKKYMILVGFGLSMVAIVALFTVFFRKDCHGDYSYTGFDVSAWIATFAALLGVAMLWPMWGCKVACIAFIPYLVWIIVIAFLLMDIAKRNGCGSERSHSERSHSDHSHSH